MGGSILVSKGRVFAISTSDFDYLAERIRPELSANDPSVAAVAYEAMDEGGMTFLCLHELDAKNYRMFVDASKRAQSKALIDGLFLKRPALWHTFLEMLEEDKRFSAELPLSGCA
jgi:hypothetical protein